ncbi:MAG: hypothetical protein NC120_03385 [Ruminococcus sp.]|nr:hypothetical protein [Ruminococcus sp.]
MTQKRQVGQRFGNFRGGLMKSFGIGGQTGICSGDLLLSEVLAAAGGERN